MHLRYQHGIIEGASSKLALFDLCLEKLIVLVHLAQGRTLDQILEGGQDYCFNKMTSHFPFVVLEQNHCALKYWVGRSPPPPKCLPLTWHFLVISAHLQLRCMAVGTLKSLSKMVILCILALAKRIKGIES